MFCSGEASEAFSILVACLDFTICSSIWHFLMRLLDILLNSHLKFLVGLYRSPERQVNLLFIYLFFCQIIVLHLFLWKRINKLSEMSLGEKKKKSPVITLHFPSSLNTLCLPYNYQLSRSEKLWWKTELELVCVTCDNAVLKHAT